MEELEQLLDEVQLIENDLYEEINEREYSIKIWYGYRADECYYLLKETMRKGKYDDSQVVVNVSPGTAVVTSAMTLNAIKGNRAMIYTTQHSKHEVISANPKATLIQLESLIEEKEFGGAK